MSEVSSLRWRMPRMFAKQPVHVLEPILKSLRKHDPRANTALVQRAFVVHAYVAHHRAAGRVIHLVLCLHTV